MAQICLRRSNFQTVYSMTSRQLQATPSRRFAVSTTDQPPGTPEAKAILAIDKASDYCKSNVKKFDYYAFRVAEHFPKKQQPYYFAINQFFIEVLKSREISREVSICQTRLHWWAETLRDIEAGRATHEPVARMLQEVKQNTKVNFKLLHRLVDYQLFDIDRGDMQTMQELEI